MSSLAESNRLNDLLKWEQENLYSREGVTVISGQDLSLGAVVGRITKDVPATGTAGGTNTGDGTCTGVTGGDDTQIGTYTLVCTSVPTGSATVPATGTADGGNTGGGGMASVTGGAAVEIGTYTIECVTAPDTVDTGAAKGTVTAGSGNTGTGTIGDVAVAAGAIVGTYTLECIEPDTDAGAFRVEDPNGDYVGTATVAVEFSAGGLTFTIADDETDFAVGDSFAIAVPTTGDGGEFQVKTPSGEVLADQAAVGAAFTSAHLNFTISHNTTAFIVGDKFTVAVTEADHNLGTFSVTAPNGESLPPATADSAYTNNQINFTINDGDTDFAAGDSFTIVVAAGSGKVTEIDFTAVDGSQAAAGFVIADYDASSGDVSGVAVVRDAVIVADNLVWPDGATSDQKAAALAELKLLGIVDRDQA